MLRGFVQLLAPRRLPSIWSVRRPTLRSSNTSTSRLARLDLEASGSDAASLASQPGELEEGEEGGMDHHAVMVVDDEEDEEETQLRYSCSSAFGFVVPCADGRMLGL